jgi:hypothetical protein
MGRKGVPGGATTEAANGAGDKVVHRQGPQCFQDPDIMESLNRSSKAQYP